jgi:hypothetical protein
MSEPNNNPAALAPRPPRELREVQSSIPIFDTGDFEHMQRVAKALSMASVIPDHLRAKPYFFPSKGSLAPAELKELRASLGEAEWQRAWQEADARTAANCFLVVNQARNWNMDPVAVAMASYVVGGKIAYEGKLVAALVNTRAKLVQKLWYTFDGEGLDLQVTVHGTREGETEDRTVRARVRDVKTENQMWTKDPEQKLVYTGSIKWARRWVPEVVLGVMTDDDIEVMEREKNITPTVAHGGGGVSALEARVAAHVAEQVAVERDRATIEKATGPAGLGSEAVAELRGIAADAGVAWSAVEEDFGGPVEDLTGSDLTVLFAEVDKTIQQLAKRRGESAESTGSLFDDGAKSAGKKPGKG